MTRDEVLRKIQEARRAIREYKEENLQEAYSTSERDKVRAIQDESERLIMEAKTIGAAGQVCPRCGGSGRV
jgi:transcription initiation factor IIE alpha subunit